jgi:hypothetical protein
MRYLPLALAALAGAMLALALRPAPQVPDTTGPYVEQLAVTVQARDRALKALDATTKALADSTEAWEAQRNAERERADKAEAEADSIATEFAATLDTAGTRRLADLRAAHRREVMAERARADSFEVENTALRAGMRTAELVIRAQRDEIHAWEALDAERQDMEKALRSALNRKTWANRLTLVAAGVGLAFAAIN